MNFEIAPIYPPRHQLSALVYTDHTHLLGVVERAFDRFHIAATIAADKQEAMNAMRNIDIDLAVVDFSCTDDAAEVARAKRDSRLNHSTALIGIAVSPVQQRKAFECGAAMTFPQLGTVDQAVSCLRSSLFAVVRKRRAAMRFGVDLPARFSINGNWLASSVNNISEGGIGLCSKAFTPSAGQPIAVEFYLPEVDEKISAEAVVIWSQANGQFGCKFSSTRARSRHALDRWTGMQLGLTSQGPSGDARGCTTSSKERGCQ